MFVFGVSLRKARAAKETIASSHLGGGFGVPNFLPSTFGGRSLRIDMGGR